VSVMVTGLGAPGVADEEAEGLESEGGEGSARAPAGRQSTARETELKKPWRSAGGVGATDVFPIAALDGEEGGELDREMATEERLAGERRRLKNRYLLQNRSAPVQLVIMKIG
jgi:hypothetical protein